MKEGFRVVLPPLSSSSPVCSPPSPPRHPPFPSPCVAIPSAALKPSLPPFLSPSILSSPWRARPVNQYHRNMAIKVTGTE